MTKNPVTSVQLLGSEAVPEGAPTYFQVGVSLVDTFGESDVVWSEPAWLDPRSNSGRAYVSVDLRDCPAGRLNFFRKVLGTGAALSLGVSFVKDYIFYSAPDDECGRHSYRVVDTVEVEPADGCLVPKAAPAVYYYDVSDSRPRAEHVPAVRALSLPDTPKEPEKLSQVLSRVVNDTLGAFDDRLSTVDLSQLLEAADRLGIDRLNFAKVFKDAMVEDFRDSLDDEFNAADKSLSASPLGVGKGEFLIDRLAAFVERLETEKLLGAPQTERTKAWHDWVMFHDLPNYEYRIESCGETVKVPVDVKYSEVCTVQKVLQQDLIDLVYKVREMHAQEFKDPFVAPTNAPLSESGACKLVLLADHQPSGDFAKPSVPPALPDLRGQSDALESRWDGMTATYEARAAAKLQVCDLVPEPPKPAPGCRCGSNGIAGVSTHSTWCPAW